MNQKSDVVIYKILKIYVLLIIFWIYTEQVVTKSYIKFNSSLIICLPLKAFFYHENIIELGNKTYLEGQENSRSCSFVYRI